MINPVKASSSQATGMKSRFLFAILCATVGGASGQSKAIVFQSDFGVKDGAVSAMKGVAYSISSDLHIFDLTHEIPPYDIREASIRLRQAAPYWPAGTVFVSVVDPGVGSERKSIVVKSKTGHYFVTPDNGTLTLVAEAMGVAEVREIDESRNRLPQSGDSHTFHGRDVYAFTGARLAAGIITFGEVGPVLTTDLVLLDFEKPIVGKGVIYGTIEILDVQYGNVWTNIDRKWLEDLSLSTGEPLHVSIWNGKKIVFEGDVLFATTFAEVPPGSSVAYLNSIHRLSLAVNQGSFAKRYKIGSGPGWTIQVSKARPPK